MNRRILVQATAPAVAIGLLMFVACLVSAWYINRLQTHLAYILSQNVSSLHAAQQMEIHLRKMRFGFYLYIVNRDPSLFPKIEQSEKEFGIWLGRAKESANSEEEWGLLRRIEDNFNAYLEEYEPSSNLVEGHMLRWDKHQLTDSSPIGRVVEPCQEFFQVNERMMEQSAQESDALSRKLRLLLLLLGLGGPVGGLILGYGISRGLTRSIYRFSVCVQDMAQRLDQDVASVQVVANGDLQSLDRQLQQVVLRFQEVAERLQCQQRELLRAQQLAAVGQLAASVAHEIRNPLTSIKMLVEAALRVGSPRPFTDENLAIVHGEVVRLERTMQGFLDFARPPALEKLACDLREVVRQAIELVKARSRQQHVDLEVHLPGRPVCRPVDRGQFCTVIVNLLINALDAMPRGGKIEVKLQTSADEEVRLEVADTGPGIAEEIREKLFTPFSSTRETGSGLGLSISKRIIEEHGGKIAAHDGVEGGARFTITFPRIS